MGYKGYEQEEFQKAINWICIKLNIDNCEYGFGKQEQISDWEFIRKYRRTAKKEIETKPLIPYDKSILRISMMTYGICNPHIVILVIESCSHFSKQLPKIRRKIWNFDSQYGILHL